MFHNVASLWVPRSGNLKRLLESDAASGIVAFKNGKLVCAADGTMCSHHIKNEEATIVDLKGGAIGPGFVSAGSTVGLQEIAMEASTTDGYVADPLLGSLPKVLGGDFSLIKAVDGLQFETRDALYVTRLSTCCLI